MLNRSYLRIQIIGKIVGKIIEKMLENLLEFEQKVDKQRDWHKNLRQLR